MAHYVILEYYDDFENRPWHKIVDDFNTNEEAIEYFSKIKKSIDKYSLLRDVKLAKL